MTVSEVLEMYNTGEIDAEAAFALLEFVHEKIKEENRTPDS